MVYELYLEAVRTKVTRFEHASRLINGKELACAVGMAFQQAGLPMPEPEAGTEAENFQNESLKALEEKKVAAYVTDFPSDKVIGKEGVIAIPHLGASTPESEENCAYMAARQVKDFLENGNIKNSVNFPNCDMGICKAAGRITVLHRNIPNMIGQITAALASESINISDMTNKSRDKYAYTMVDVEQRADEETVERIRAIDGVLRVRAL